MTLIDAALGYSEHGWRVFPLHSASLDHCSCRRSGCSSRAKHPRTANGLKDATLDRRQIEAWWRRWPEANVGLLTGALARLVVVDLDGEEGLASWAAITDGRDLPVTREAITGGGGRHVYWLHPGGSIRNSASRLGDHVDVRADGGYVLAPPSNHVSGRRYQWANAERVAPCPPWLLGLLRPPPRARVVPKVRPAGGCSAYSAAALRGEVARVAGTANGTRNHTLNAAAFSLGTLVGAGALEEVVVIDALVSAALSSGLGETEARRTIASGLRAGVGAPRVLETVTGGPA